jgi:hypothetical protein
MSTIENNRAEIDTVQLQQPLNLPKKNTQGPSSQSTTGSSFKSEFSSKQKKQTEERFGLPKPLAY